MHRWREKISEKYKTIWTKTANFNKYLIILKMRKFKQEIVQSSEIKIRQAQVEKKKRIYKNCYYKRKNLLNDLINRVEKLENLCLNK